MAWKSAVRVELDEADRRELEARTRRQNISCADAMRAEIVLLAADSRAIAKQLGVTRVTVRLGASGSMLTGWTALPTSPAPGPAQDRG